MDVLKLDSGAPNTYLKQDDMTYISKVTKILGPSSIYLADTSYIIPTHVGHLILHLNLSTTAQTVTIVPGLTNSSLFSIGKVCSDNCAIFITKTRLHAIENVKYCSRNTVIKSIGCGLYHCLKN